MLTATMPPLGGMATSHRPGQATDNLDLRGRGAGRRATWLAHGFPIIPPGYRPQLRVIYREGNPRWAMPRRGIRPILVTRSETSGLESLTNLPVNMPLVFGFSRAEQECTRLRVWANSKHVRTPRGMRPGRSEIRGRPSTHRMAAMDPPRFFAGAGPRPSRFFRPPEIQAGAMQAKKRFGPGRRPAAATHRDPNRRNAKSDALGRVGGRRPRPTEIQAGTMQKVMLWAGSAAGGRGPPGRKQAQCETDALDRVRGGRGPPMRKAPRGA